MPGRSRPPRQPRRVLHGVLLLDKPLGWTSHDALAKAKDRAAQINSLMLRAGQTIDQKEIQEVTARIGAENALLQHEVSQIELMRGLAEADQRVADSRAREGQLEQASRNRRLADFIRD